ncbi:efflux RND transporter periplasmic adaptor subunit [Alkaliphilus oremlandii]|uniref:Efflux transporter, RND family, MFP subunit n=1 Tax=Alkaliphilus oremlandii (strain OhILAs) TaxID=350688 RepID=A8MFR8_ALKOO|nr:efflux RND transporter periplasmic adaptor subunit [Alkaliphilus oremlandii]ABW17707.1 efflux transporter, RND family, MFP subunit [Alkaliphilus oremlandii OhILAs]
MKFFKKRKVMIGVVVAALIIGVVSVNARLKSSATSGMAVNVADVVKKEIKSTLNLKAPLQGTENVEVVSRLHYEILSIDVKEGDKVEKDQVLAVLDVSRLEEEIEKLKDNVELLQIQNTEGKSSKETSAALAEQRLNEELENNQRNYETALEMYHTAKSRYDSTKVLYDSGAASKWELVDKENALNDAKRKVDTFNVVNGKVQATEAQLAEMNNAKISSNNASGVKSIEIAKKELERKKKELEDCKIKSSITGTITRVNAKVGRFADEIDDRKPMFVIENVDTLKMVANVSEYDIGKLEIGQKVKISADILNGAEVDGVVSRISPTGEQKQGSNERVIPVQIDVVGDTKGLIAGINASAKVETAIAEDALVIPLEALIDGGDNTYSVFVVKEDKTIQKINVSLGVEDVLEVQIISDEIKEGDQVILNPQTFMTDGMSVIVNE